MTTSELRPHILMAVCDPVAPSGLIGGTILDKGGFYDALSTGDWGTREALLGAAAAGAALGVGSAIRARSRKKKAVAEEEA